MTQHLSEMEALAALRRTIRAAHSDICEIQMRAEAENTLWLREKASGMRAALAGAGRFIQVIEEHARLRPQPTLRQASGHTEAARPDPYILRGTARIHRKNPNHEPDPQYTAGIERIAPRFRDSA